MLFKDKLSDIIRTLENDGLLLHPTDTSWEIACSVLSSKAISKINEINVRKINTPLTLLIDSIAHLKKYVPHIHPRIETLLHFHKKPLTVVFSKTESIPEHAISKDGQVAFRIINDPYCSEIIKLLGVPLISLTASTDGQSHPEHFSQIPHHIIENANYISMHKRDIEFHNKPPVMINYDEEGEINFLSL